MIIAFIIMGICIGISPNADNSKDSQNTNIVSSVLTKKQIDIETVDQTKSANTSSVNGQLKIHYIDVGQAVSNLIQQGNAFMLIDAGSKLFFINIFQ